MKTKVRATVICRRAKQVLLVSKDGVIWALPGGRPARGEDLSTAAGRELKEETTLSADDLRYVFQVVGATTVHHVFVAGIGKSATPRPSQEIARCRWFSVREMAEIVTSPTTRHIVESFFHRLAAEDRCPA